jgi:hypothetical protein
MLTVAELLGTSKSNVTALLGGARNMTMHTLADLAFVLGNKVIIKPEPLNCVSSWQEFYQQVSECPKKFSYEYASRNPGTAAADDAAGDSPELAFAA